MQRWTADDGAEEPEKAIHFFFYGRLERGERGDIVLARVPG